MRRRTPIGICVFAVVAAAAVVHCGAPSRTEVAASSDAQTHPAAERMVSFVSGTYHLKGALLVPAGEGPFPAIVDNHGSENDPSLEYLGDMGRWFQAHGYVVFFPYRRGAGGSEGPYFMDAFAKLPEGDVEARGEFLVRAIDDENADVLAAIDWLKTQPFVQPRRIAVSGCSFGGIQALITAGRSHDIFAAVDFAGASMTWDRFPAIRARMTRAADDARVPVFFLQAENDFNTSPTIVLSGIMERAGKQTRKHVFPPHGTTHMDGHAGFCTHGMPEWGNEVLAFLAGIP